MQTSIRESKIADFIFADTRISALWLLARLWLGWEWLSAGWDKFTNPAWIGDQAGTALTGFLNGTLAKTGGAHPDVSGWYAYFVQHFALAHITLFSYMVTLGEIAVGLALIAGFLVGISAFFGVFMNLNFLFAGTVSVNPIMLLIGILLMASWRTAGYFGLDRFVLPKLFKKPGGNL